nr:reverse transcriptase domain-containing protein [Tanacetum cinerariifolium]
MYGAEAVIPVEIGMPTLRTVKVDMIKNDEALGVNLDLLQEKREQAAIQEARSKAKMDKYYNTRVRNTSFHSEVFVYRSNEASRAKDGGKLEPKPASDDRLKFTFLMVLLKKCNTWHD